MNELTVSIPAPKGDETAYAISISDIPFFGWFVTVCEAKQSGTVPSRYEAASAPEASHRTANMPANHVDILHDK